MGQQHAPKRRTDSRGQMKAPAPLALRDQAPIEPWRDAEWQKLWLAVQARSWNCLAICPAAAGSAPDFALTVAVALARTGMTHLGTPIQVADATRIQLSNVRGFKEEVQRYREQGDLVLLALAPVSQSTVSISLAQSADYAVLCVLLEHMSSAGARETVTKIGKEHFLGTAVFRADMLPVSV